MLEGEESLFEVSALIKVFFAKVCLEYEDKGEVTPKERFTSDKVKTDDDVDGRYNNGDDIDGQSATKFVDGGDKVIFDVIVDNAVDCAGDGNSSVLWDCNDKGDDDNTGDEVGAVTEWITDDFIGVVVFVVADDDDERDDDNNEDDDDKNGNDDGEIDDTDEGEEKE